jgi:CBS domain containing-hemolysin-like protein
MAKDESEKSSVPNKRHMTFRQWLARNLGAKSNPPDEQEIRQVELQKSLERLGLELSSLESGLEADEREMIHGIVELGTTEVREVMVPRVDIVGVEVGSPIADVIDVIGKSGHSRFPLYVDSFDNIKGILYAKDLLAYNRANGTMDLVKISRKPFFIPENLKLDDLLRDMKRRRLHIAIVVDEYGGTAGLVTMEDIIEEIVGEIEDEYDKDLPPIVRQSKNTFLVDGSVTISDLNDETGLDLPEEEFETVGGLIYDLVGSLPEKGRSIVYHQVTFVVEQVEGQRIVKVKLIAADTAARKSSTH